LDNLLDHPVNNEEDMADKVKEFCLLGCNDVYSGESQFGDISQKGDLFTATSVITPDQTI
jgi:hypothetical protein